MRAKNKKKVTLLFLAGCVLVGYWLWLSMRSVEIVAVHQRNNYSDVLIKNFPLTDKGKIRWWLKNKTALKEKVNVPNPAGDRFFFITFWDFGDEYKEEGKYDRLCFSDMEKKENCIEKDAVFSVRQYRDDDIIFVTYEGRYSLNDRGEIIKIKRE